MKTNERNQSDNMDPQIARELETLEQLFTMHPSSDLAIDIALLYDELGNIEQASHYFNRALELDPNNARAYYGQGMIYENEGKIDEAISYYKEAIALDPNYVAAHFFLACLYDDIAEVYLAIYHYEQVLALDPTHFYAHLNIGSVYEGLNQDETALQYFKAAERINPHNHLLHFNFGVIYQKKREYEKSRDAYIRSLSYSEDYPYTYLNLGLLYKDHFQDLDQAINVYSEGIRHHPEFAVLYYNRGCVYALKDAYDLAREDLEQALYYMPSLRKDLLKDPELEPIKSFFEK